MQTLAEVTNLQALNPTDKVRLLDIQDLEIKLEMERRRRESIAETGQIVRIENKHKAFVAAYPLQQFIRETFPVIEQGREFRDNWHISVICELLQATVLGDVRNFIINQPRRTMKSLLVCVMLPCWVWTFLPYLQFLFTSYTEKFAKRDNRKCLRLIKSNYYQRRFGHLFALTSERADLIENTSGGSRTIFTIGGGTGTGGDLVLCDDPNNIKEAESDLVLEKTNTDWDEVSYHNVTDRGTAVRGIIQQRSAPNDLSGHIIDDPDTKKLYQILTLPMRYESDHPYKNSAETPLQLGLVSEHEKTVNSNLVIGEPKLWIDPRGLDAPDFDNIWYQEWYRENFTDKGLTSKGNGQLLWENYITEEIIQQEIAHLKVYGEAGQLQQRPYRRGGNFFNSEHFEVINESALDLNGLVFVRYWDKAGSDNSGDWTVGLLMARTKKRPFRFWIVNVIRKQIGYYERMELMMNTTAQDTADYVTPFDDNEYTVMIEREPSSSGKDLATIEKDALVGYDVLIDNVRKDKGTRAKPVRNHSEGGKIKVIKAPWNVPFFRELEKFDPKKKNQVNDQIDGLSGAFRQLCFGGQSSGGSVEGSY